MDPWLPSCPTAPRPGPHLRRAAHRPQSARAHLQAMQTQLAEVCAYNLSDIMALLSFLQTPC